MDYSLDVGNNLTFLGVLFLALKYILPVLLGFFILAAIAVGAYIGYQKLPAFSENKTTIFVIALGFLALIALLS